MEIVFYKRNIVIWHDPIKHLETVLQTNNRNKKNPPYVFMYHTGSKGSTVLISYVEYGGYRVYKGTVLLLLIL